MKTVRPIDPDRRTTVLHGTLGTSVQFVSADENAFHRLYGRGIRNPLLRGNELPAAVGNGVLTAEEVTGLDLSGMELVVLSACQTGIGKVEPGEGSLGFPARLYSPEPARSF